MTEEVDERVEYICSRFRAHRAAEFEFISKTPSMERRVTITLIPEFLIKDEGEPRGLLIVGKGQGSHTWDGRAVLSPFSLVAAGFRPLQMALQLATLLNAVVGTARALIEANPAQEPLSLGHDGEHYHGNSTKRAARRNRPRGGDHDKGAGERVPKRRGRSRTVGTKPSGG